MKVREPDHKILQSSLKLGLVSVISFLPLSALTAQSNNQAEILNSPRGAENRAQVTLVPPVGKKLRFKTIEEREFSGVKIRHVIERNVVIERLGRGYTVSLAIVSIDTDGPEKLVARVAAGYRLLKGKEFNFTLSADGQTLKVIREKQYWDMLNKGIEALKKRATKQNLSPEQYSRLIAFYDQFAALSPSEREYLGVAQLAPLFQFSGLKIELNKKHKISSGNNSMYGVPLSPNSIVEAKRTASGQLALTESIGGREAPLEHKARYIISDQTGMLVSSREKITTRTASGTQNTRIWQSVEPLK